MSLKSVVALLLTASAPAALASPAAAQGQSPAPTAQHKHYETPPDYQAPAPGMPIAPRLQNLGVHTFPVSTRHERAQLFMNQGLNLVYGFNHAEAARAFAEAARLDSSLAMAYWGQALVLGPNINAPMDPADEPKALDLAKKAVAMKSGATRREQAYIDALAARYTGRGEDRQKADRAYADAMRRVVEDFPDDLDARTLYAEALMDLRPWNYWTRDGVAYPETAEVQSSLEKVLAAHQNHPGALHLWIHLWEPTDTPERAEAEADRLLPLMPGAGHIVHMPAHIYQRVGRYDDVVRANLLAAKADEDYIAQCRAQGLYPLGYYPHNLHFIWMGATASGRRQLALESAEKLANAVPQEALGTVPILQGFLVVPYWAMVRFGEWDRILADKGPRHETAFTKGAWHYARAMAFLAKNELDKAEQERVKLAALVADPSLKGQTTFSTNTGEAILRIAPEVVAGELAAKRKDWDKAILHLDRAVRYEDALIYQEPPDWHAPVRQNLAGVLVAAGRADEAEAVYWEDLKKNPETGWSLFGLAQALKAQGKTDEAAGVEARFRKAWTHADITLGPATTATVAARGEEGRMSKEGLDARFVTLPTGVRLEYVEQGAPDGLPVIFLHGVTDSWRSFEPVLQRLPRSIRAFSLSQRGHGESSKPETGYRYADFSEDVRAFMDALALPRAVIVGHSMGALVAQRLIADHPGRVQGMVLLGSFATLHGNAGMAEFVDTAIRPLLDPISPDFAREWQMSTTARPIDPQFLDTVVAETLKVPSPVWRQAFDGFLQSPDFTDELRSVSVPVLLIWGDRDTYAAREDQERLLKAMKTARLAAYEGVGHAIHWEVPERVVGALVDFLGIAGAEAPALRTPVR